MAAPQETISWAAAPRDFSRADAGAMALVTDMVRRPAFLPELLTSTEHDREDSLRLKSGPQRGIFLRRRLLARLCVARYLGIEPADCVIAHGAAGKPVLVSPQARLHLSVSARGEIAAVAVARTRIGIDLERADGPHVIPWNILRANERAALNGLPEAERIRAFLRLWTVKEAYLKALGTGLNARPEAVDVTDIDTDTPRLSAHGAEVAALIDIRRMTVSGAPVTAACVVLPD